MKKFIRLVTMLTMSVTIVIPVLAEGVQELQFIQLNGFTKLRSEIQKSFKNTNKYTLDTTITDAYGNLVAVRGRYEGDFYHFVQTSDKYTKKVKTINATRYGYKPITFDLVIPKTQTIVLEPTEIKQVTMGKIVLPENAPKDNWWIELIPTKDMGEAQGVIIKVKSNGSFKFLNLQDGDYKIRIFRGVHKQGYGSYFGNCIWDESHVGYIGNLRVKGNLNITFDLRNTVVDAISMHEYGTVDIDYSNPQKYLAVDSTQLRLSDETKKFADESFNNNKDLSTVVEIMRYILNNYWSELGKTDTDMIASDIVKQGYASGCTQFATIFQALAEYKGIPTVLVNTIDLNWIKEVQENVNKVDRISGHMYVECFVDGKWILVDPTSCRIVENYDPTAQTIFDFSLEGQPIEHIVMTKAEDVSSLRYANLRSSEKLVALYGDLAVLDNLERIKPNILVNRTAN